MFLIKRRNLDQTLEIDKFSLSEGEGERLGDEIYTSTEDVQIFVIK